MIPRGRGRGTPRNVGAVGKMTSTSEPSSPDLLDINVTEVVDLTTFWAQIGTETQLSDFEQYCISLSAQCEDKKESTQDGPITVGHVVAVRDPVSRGRWHRAQVTRILPARTVEVHFVDTGKSGRVSVSDLCTQVPELAFQMSSQALQCNLEGVTMIEDNDALQEMTMTCFKEIASQPLKTVVHDVSDGVLFLSLYASHGDHWVSVGEILKLETLVKYSPPGLVMVDHLVNPLSSSPKASSPDIEIESDSSTVVDDDEASSPQQLGKVHYSTEVPVCYDLVTLSGNEEAPPLTALSEGEMSIPQIDTSVETASLLETGASVETASLLQTDTGVDSAPLPPDSAAPLAISSTDSEVYSSFNLPPLVASTKLKSFRLALPKLVVSLPSTKPVDEKSVVAENATLEAVTDMNNNEFLPPNTSKSSSVDIESECTSISDVSAQAATDSIEEASSIVHTLINKPNIERSAPFMPTLASESSISDTLQNEHCVPSQQLASSTPEEYCSTSSLPPTQDDPYEPSSGSPIQDDPHKSTSDSQPSQDDSHATQVPAAGLSDEDSSDGDWDDSLLPPRTESQSRSNSGTPMNTPEKRPPKEGRGKKNVHNTVKAKFEALFGSSENIDHQPKKSKWSGGKKHSHHWQPNYNPQRTSGSFDFNSRNNTFSQQFGRGAGRGTVYRRRDSGVSYQDPGYQSDIGRGGWSRYNNPGSSPRVEYERKREPSFSPPPAEFVSPQFVERVGRINLEGTVQRAQLSKEAMVSEYKWHTWKILNSVEKLVSTLTEENVKNFGHHLSEILNGPSAKTLVALQYKEPPLKILLDSVFSQVRMDKAELLAEGITGAIAELQDPRLYELLKDAFSSVGHKVCLNFEDTAVKKHDFCLFSQKLFVAANSSKIEKYIKCVEQGIMLCLKTWISSFTQEVSLQEQLYCIECFVSLCERVGPVLNSASNNSFEKCFEGPVKECILSNECPRDVKEQLLELSLKRVGEWSKTEPSITQCSSVPVNQSSSEPTFKRFSQPVQASSPVPVTFQRASTGPSTPPLPAPQDDNQYRPAANTYSVPSDVQCAPLTAPQSVSLQSLPSVLNMGYPTSAYQSELQGVMVPLRLEPSQVPPTPAYVYSAQKENSTSGVTDPYKQTLDMLEYLGFQELLSTFKQHMFRDFLFFDVNNDLPMIKECLSSAQLPIGAVVGIMSYLENKRKAPSVPSSYSAPPQLPAPPQSTALQQMSPSQFSLYYPSLALQQQTGHSSVNIGATPTNLSGNGSTHSLSATPVLPSPGQHAMSTPNERMAGQPTNRHGLIGDNLHGTRGGTPGGGYHTFNCFLCQSNDHSSMECKYRERLNVH